MGAFYWFIGDMPRAIGDFLVSIGDLPEAIGDSKDYPRFFPTKYVLPFSILFLLSVVNI